jgi:hypothetical protein
MSTGSENQPLGRTHCEWGNKVAKAAHERNEQTQRELAALDNDFGPAGLVQPADCAETGHPPGDGGPASANGGFKTGPAE